MTMAPESYIANTPMPSTMQNATHAVANILTEEFEIVQAKQHTPMKARINPMEARVTQRA